MRGAERLFCILKWRLFLQLYSSFKLLAAGDLGGSCRIIFWGSDLTVLKIKVTLDILFNSSEFSLMFLLTLALLDHSVF